MDEQEFQEVVTHYFLEEIYFQVLAALRTRDRLGQVVRSQKPLEIEDEGIYFTYMEDARLLIEQFLLHCANLTRIFKNPDRPARTLILRTAFEMDSDNVLYSSHVRNAFQHQDEYIDRLIAARRRGVQEMPPLGKGMGVLYNGTFSITWYGRSITMPEVESMVGELQRLKNLIDLKWPFLMHQRVLARQIAEL